MTKPDYERAKRELHDLNIAILKKQDEMRASGYPEDIIDNAIFKQVTRQRELDEAIIGYELHDESEVQGAPA